MFARSLLLILDLMPITSGPLSYPQQWDWGCCCRIPSESLQFVSLLITFSPTFLGRAYNRESVSASWQRAADHWLLLSLVFTNSPTSVSMVFNQSWMNSCGPAWVSFCSVFGMFLPALAQPAWMWLTFITSGLCMIKQNFIEVACIILLRNGFLWNTK